MTTDATTTALSTALSFRLPLKRPAQLLLGTRKRIGRLCLHWAPVTMRAPHWDGGSRDTYHLVSRTGETRPVPFPPWSWPAPPPEAQHQPCADWTLVKSGVFRGQESAPLLYVSAVTGWPWVPEAAQEEADDLLAGIRELHTLGGSERIEGLVARLRGLIGT